jgi:hypothetical protein
MAHCDLFTNQSINSIIPFDDYDPDFVYMANYQSQIFTYVSNRYGNAV